MNVLTRTIVEGVFLSLIARDCRVLMESKYIDNQSVIRPCIDGGF
jgi:hypothetical protein